MVLFGNKEEKSIEDFTILDIKKYDNTFTLKLYNSLHEQWSKGQRGGGGGAIFYLLLFLIATSSKQQRNQTNYLRLLEQCRDVVDFLILF